MTGPTFARLEDVLLDELFPEVDLVLRRGGHIGREDGASYRLLSDGRVHFEAFYRRYGCELIQRSEGYFYLLPRNERLGRRMLTSGEMLVGQVLALLSLDPSTVQQGGTVTREDVLRRLDMLLGPEELFSALLPKHRYQDKRAAEASIRTKVYGAMRSLEALGFVELRDDRIQLRQALLRFADPVRNRDPQLLERLISLGELSLIDAGAGNPKEDP